MSSDEEEQTLYKLRNAEDGLVFPPSDLHPTSGTYDLKTRTKSVIALISSVKALMSIIIFFIVLTPLYLVLRDKALATFVPVKANASPKDYFNIELSDI